MFGILCLNTGMVSVIYPINLLKSLANSVYFVLVLENKKPSQRFLNSNEVVSYRQSRVFKKSFDIFLNCKILQ